MKTALVTGHQGFIGRHIMRALDEAGYVTHGTTDALDFFAHSEYSFDVAVHAAAASPHREAADRRPLDVAENLELDAAMFRWAVRSRVGRVVYLSSSAAYPVRLQDEPVALAEDDIKLAYPKLPDGIYGWCKLTGERLAALAREAGVPVTVVRPFSGYGEDQSADHPFGAMRDRALAKADPFDIWGDGTQVRDFIHVDDICAAIMVMIDRGLDGPVNLGWGAGTSMSSLALAFTWQAGYSPVFRYLTDQPSGVAYRIADTQRLAEICRPEVTLMEGIDRALKTGLSDDKLIV